MSHLRWPIIHPSGDDLKPGLLDSPACGLDSHEEASKAMRDTTHWVGTWTAAPAPAEGAAFANHTLRMTPRVSIGGSRLRVRISNAYGVRPLAIGAARVGLRGTGPAVLAGPHRPLPVGRAPPPTHS